MRGFVRASRRKGCIVSERSIEGVIAIQTQGKEGKKIGGKQGHLTSEMTTPLVARMVLQCKSTLLREGLCTCF